MISEKCLQVPLNTSQMSALIEEIKDAETTKMAELLNDQKEQIKRLLLIIENSTLVSNDGEKAAKICAYHLNMKLVFEEHQSIIENKQKQFKDNLRVFPI